MKNVQIVWMVPWYEHVIYDNVFVMYWDDDPSKDRSERGKQKGELIKKLQ